MKTLQNNRMIAEIISAALSIIIGLLLLIRPSATIDLAVAVLSLLLCGMGIFWLVRYLRTEPIAAAHSYDLAEALVALSLGITFFFKKGLFEAILPRIWGLVLMVGAFLILQSAIDFLRLKFRYWYIMLIGAGISMALGILAITTPAFLNNSLPIFIGVSLIVEGAIHITSTVFLHSVEKGRTATPPAASASPVAKATSSVSSPASAPSSSAKEADDERKDNPPASDGSGEKEP